MSFLILISVPTGLLLLLARWFTWNLSLRDAMRIGMAFGFLFTGTDHFLSAHTRYVPMMPSFLAPWALELVYFTGAAEILGAIGLLMPLRLYHRLGIPPLRRAAGVALAVMLVCVVIANINVAMTGQTVQGLDFGAWYFWIRPAFQPVFVLWALYCSGVIDAPQVFRRRFRKSEPVRPRSVN
jgi:uncharacterized membrane protein